METQPNLQGELKTLFEKFSEKQLDRNKFQKHRIVVNNQKVTPVKFKNEFHIYEFGRTQKNETFAIDLRNKIIYKCNILKNGTWVFQYDKGVPYEKVNSRPFEEVNDLFKDIKEHIYDDFNKTDFYKYLNDKLNKYENCDKTFTFSDYNGKEKTIFFNNDLYIYEMAESSINNVFGIDIQTREIYNCEKLSNDIWTFEQQKNATFKSVYANPFVKIDKIFDYMYRMKTTVRKFVNQTKNLKYEHLNINFDFQENESIFNAVKFFIGNRIEFINSINPEDLTQLDIKNAYKKFDELLLNGAQKLEKRYDEIIAAGEQEKTDLADKLDQIKDALAGTGEDLEHTKGENTFLQGQLRGLQTRNDEIQDTLQRVTEDTKILKNSLETKMETCDKFEAKNVELAEENKKLQTSNAQLIAKNEEIQETHDNAIPLINQKEQEIKTLVANMRQIKNELTEIKQSNLEFESQNVENNTKLKEYQNQTQKLEETNSQLQDINKTLTTEIGLVQRENLNLRASNQEYFDNLQECEQRKLDLLDTLDEFKEETAKKFERLSSPPRFDNTYGLREDNSFFDDVNTSHNMRDTSSNNKNLVNATSTVTFLNSEGRRSSNSTDNNSDDSANSSFSGDEYPDAGTITDLKNDANFKSKATPSNTGNVYGTRSKKGSQKPNQTPTPSEQKLPNDTSTPSQKKGRRKKGSKEKTAEREWSNNYLQFKSLS